MRLQPLAGEASSETHSRFHDPECLSRRGRERSSKGSARSMATGAASSSGTCGPAKTCPTISTTIPALPPLRRRSAISGTIPFRSRRRYLVIAVEHSFDFGGGEGRRFGVFDAGRGDGGDITVLTSGGGVLRSDRGWRRRVPAVCRTGLPSRRSTQPRSPARGLSRSSTRAGRCRARRWRGSTP